MPGPAYAFPWLLPAAAGQVLFTQVTTWLPIALIGIELARLSGSAARRFAGLALSGLAISQILASWLGQGSYYALLVIGGWVAWRTLVTPPSGWSARERLIGLVGIGGGILLIGVGLNAAALLVRLEANTRTNLAGGVYTGLSGWAESNIGVPLEEIVPALVGGFGRASWQYVGASVVALALLAPFVALRWPPLLFWFLVAAAAVILTLPERTPLHAGMYALLPRFETIHSHLPERVLLTTPLAVAMLAGATADALSRNLPGVALAAIVGAPRDTRSRGRRDRPRAAGSGLLGIDDGGSGRPGHRRHSDRTSRRMASSVDAPHIGGGHCLGSGRPGARGRLGTRARTRALAALGGFRRRRGLSLPERRGNLPGRGNAGGSRSLRWL